LRFWVFHDIQPPFLIHHASKSLRVKLRIGTNENQKYYGDAPLDQPNDYKDAQHRNNFGINCPAISVAGMVFKTSSNSSVRSPGYFRRKLLAAGENFFRDF